MHRRRRRRRRPKQQDVSHPAGLQGLRVRVALGSVLLFGLSLETDQSIDYRHLLPFSVDGVRRPHPVPHVQEARQEAALGGGGRGGAHADEDLSTLQLHH